MAEPYDTIESIGSGPTNWYRMQSASGNVSNEGSQGSNDLTQISSFNGTYQYGTNPFGDTNAGILCNGTGGLASSGIASSYAKGTMMMVIEANTAGSPTSDRYLTGVYDGQSDDDYVDIYVGAAGEPKYHIQDDTPDNQDWQVTASDVGDGDPHSVAAVCPTNASALPIIVIDGVAGTVTEASQEGTDIDNDWWMDEGGWDNAGGDNITAFYRGGFGTGHDDWIIYEILFWAERLTEAQIQTAHNALFNIASGLSKRTRRSGRLAYGI